MTPPHILTELVRFPAELAIDRRPSLKGSDDNNSFILYFGGWLSPF
jgi:hypothetical protein